MCNVTKCSPVPGCARRFIIIPHKMHSRKTPDWLAASEWYNYNSFWFLYNFIYAENYLQDTFLKKPKKPQGTALSPQQHVPRLQLGNGRSAVRGGQPGQCCVASAPAAEPLGSPEPSPYLRPRPLAKAVTLAEAQGVTTPNPVGPPREWRSVSGALQATASPRKWPGSCPHEAAESHELRRPKPDVSAFLIHSRIFNRTK